MQGVTNVTLNGITAVGNTAGCGGGMFMDRAALVQVLVLLHSAELHACPSTQQLSAAVSCRVQAPNRPRPKPS